MLHLQKYFKNFLKLFLAQRRGRWRFWLKISSAQVFWFCNSNVTTFPTSRKYKKFNFSIYQFAAEMLYLLKYLRNFFKTFFRLKEEEPGYCGWKFNVRRYFRFAVATLQPFLQPQNIKFQFFHLPIPSRNAISLEVFDEFFKTFFLAERRGTWLLWLKI